MQEDFKSIRRLRYPLPEVIEPATSICIKVNVPNDIAYLAAFWGQMFALTRWYAWLPDSAHTAKDVAARWRTTYEQAQESECENVLVRTSPVNDCLLQVSYDGGGLWETVYNAYGCALKAAADEFGSGSDQPAGHSQPGEQPGGANPDPFQCFDLDLTVNGSGMTLIPLAIVSGWTLKFTQIKGAWNDGNIGHDWVCPNGHAFFFGTCSPLVEGVDAADPIPTSPHMLLIIRLADGTYDVIPQDGTEYVVPSGQPEGNYFLLANDSVLADNQGSVSLHVLACNTSLHCYEFDFTTGQHGFVSAFSEYGEYVEGAGWRTTSWAGSNARAVWASYNSGVGEFTLKRYELYVEFENAAVSPSGSAHAMLYGAGQGYVGGAQNPANYASGIHKIVWMGSQVISDGIIGVYSNTQGGDLTGVVRTIRKLRVFTTTENPFGADNCT